MCMCDLTNDGLRNRKLSVMKKNDSKTRTKGKRTRKSGRGRRRKQKGTKSS
jgi:hypothetical protein